MFRLKSSHASLFLQCAALCTLVISLLPVVSAQSATATVSGVVSDEKQAVIVNATVTAVNEATRLTRKVTSNADGNFTIPLLPPGNYTLTVERDGFAHARVSNVVLNVGDQRAIQIQLKVGQVGETVNVEAGAGIQESPAVGTVINRQFVENLPLNGRSFQSLFELTPGVVLTPSSNAEPGQFSVNGQRTNANYITVDGVSANAGVLPGLGVGQSANGSVSGFAATGGTNNLVSVDALQEFKIQTSSFAPEFGRTPGAQVSIVTRSGTKDFHGTLFEYFRNDVLDANDWFANRNGLKKPPLRMNDFGGVLGGPLVLPRFGEGGSPLVRSNQVFFFFSYEGLRLIQPQTSTTFVPSLAARQAAVPATQPLLNAFPVPNGPALRNPNGTLSGYAPYSVSYSDRNSLDATSVRLDYAGNRVTLFGRFNESPSNGTDRLAGPSTLGNNEVDTRTLTLGTTWTLRPTLVNDLRFNYTRSKTTADLRIDSQGGATPPPASLLFPASQSFRNPSAIVFLVEFDPVFIATGIATADRFSGNGQRQLNLVDSLSYQAGAHALKFGVDYRRISTTVAPTDYFASYAFIGIGQTAISLAQSGSLQQAQIDARPDEVVPVFQNFSAYVQDSWKATPRLMLTYGLRWDLNPAPSEANGNDPFVVTNLDTPANIAPASQGTPLYPTAYKNFAPRFGLAYQLSRRSGLETVLRGGVGVFYDLGGGGGAGAAFGGFGFPFISRKLLLGAPLVPGPLRFPLSPAEATPLPLTRSLPATSVISAFDKDIVLPRVYQWNLTVEQSLGANQTLSAAYVAAIGRKLLRQDFLAAPNANFPSGIAVTRNEAESDYHAMQLQFIRRLSRGLQALASYTWSHSIDTASSDLARTASILTFTPGLDKGDSSFDVRQSFSGALTYNIASPFKSSGMNAIFGGWATDTVFRARSGTPINVVIQNAPLQGVANITRPDLVTGVPLYLNDRGAPGGRRLNPAAFVRPAAGSQGTLGRNALDGPGAWQFDFTFRREFKLREQISLQFRTEFFNLFNHPNFGNYERRFGAPFFGQPTQMLGRSLREVGSSVGAGFNSQFQIGGPRSIQFALKLVF
ncbi:MAG: TonB-dependent receptor domain-containing protein [Blastocatellia bacterium]